MKGRGLTGAVAGFVIGAAVFAGVAWAGILLDQRLAGDSPGLFIGVLIFFGVIGAYSGWLLGLIVYSAVRGGEAEAGDRS